MAGDPQRPLAFRAERYDLVQGFCLSAVTAAEAPALGAALAAIDPWARYGIPAGALARGFMPAVDGSVRLALRPVGRETIVGAIVIRQPWLIGPYLQTLAVLPGTQGQGLGRALLDWFEAEARQGNARNLWVCVTGFNDRAQRFYGRFGFEPAAQLDDLIAPGTNEILMRKRLAP